MSCRTVTPIETVAFGYRFRSRLEARWAVVLDRLGLAWEYEAQGYTTAAGPYLPDFWLPQRALWIEVKPPGDGDWRSIDPRWPAFAADGRDLAVLCGTPGEQHIHRFKGAARLRSSRSIDFLLGDGRSWEQVVLSAKTVDAALLAGRQARFEHGEGPT